MNIGIGRSNDHIKSLHGQDIYPSFFIHLLDGEKWIKMFQFCQTKRNTLLLRIEAAEDTSDKTLLLPQLKERLLPLLWAKMGDDIFFDVELVDALKKTSAGKHRYVINEIEM